MFVGQAAVQLVAWPLALLVLAKAAREFRHSPWRFLPACATAALLAATALGSWLGEIDAINSLWFAGLPLLLATYPDGRFVPRWTALPVAVWLLAAAAFAIEADALTSQPWWLAALGTVVALLAAQVHRYRRRLSTGERETVRWAVLGLIVGFGGFAITAVIERGAIAGHGPVSVTWANLLALLIPAGLALGLIRPQWTNVDSLLHHTILAFFAALVLASAYGLSTLAAGFLGAGTSESGWWGAAAVALAAVGTLRLSRLLADWTVYQGRIDPDHAVALLQQRMAGVSSTAELQERIAEVARQCLHCEDVDFMNAPIPKKEGLRDFPLVFQGRFLGGLRVSARRGETELTRRDEAVLTAIVQHSAALLHSAAAGAAAAEARASLVQAREAERKSLRREMHDGLSPALVGMGMSAAAIAQLSKEPGVQGIAGDLAADIQDAIVQAREIAHGLRPPILDDLGLVAAIRDRVGTGAGTPQVTVAVSQQLPELPAAVELAALRIVQEAVQNVRKHAGAQNCAVRLHADQAGLHVQIEDDGTGLPRFPRHGMGLASMAERARELGGTASMVSLGSMPGGIEAESVTGVEPAAGTLVSVVFPLRQTSADGAQP